MLHPHAQFRGFSPSERRLLGKMEERKAEWDEANDAAGAVSKSKNPYEKARTHLEQVHTDIRAINSSWLHWLTLRRSRLVKRRIDAELNRKLEGASGKWNSWFQAVWHWQERRELFAEGRAQLTRDLLSMTENQANEILTRKERFGRAARFLGRENAPISAKELTAQQDLAKTLGALKTKFEAKSARVSGSLETMKGAQETEDMLWNQLVDAGVPVDELQTLFDINADGGKALREKIAAVFPNDFWHRRTLLRAAKKLKRGSRYRLLNAIQSDAINAEPPQQRLQKIDKDMITGRALEFNINGRTIHAVVLKRRSPMLTLRNTALSKNNPERILVLDTKDGFLLEKKGTGFLDHDIVREKKNTFQLPSQTVRAIS